MLEIRNLCVSYGKIEVLHAVSIRVEQGSVVSIIGSNGAGKSTLLKAISAQIKRTGEVVFCGQNVSSKPHIVVRSGIVHIPEGRKVFAGLSVLENLTMGGFINKDRKVLERDTEEMFELFPVLAERKKQYAGTLSGGEQQMLAIARGLMAHPKLLLMDEPSLGLAPIVVEAVFDIIKTVRKKGITIMLVEQNAHKSLEIADYAYVLENGRIAAEGTGCGLLESPDIAAMYLGGRKKGG